ncbi:MAG: MBL fold metallo-hydrolase [Deltaproteobacteria bacterium]|nr:MBL fold metallo-hydrolase [Deltaproteobacteria bacterium]MCB9787994.1 MBL fold metallo-hydrolase [Deltaproteobacteria bacterium]
MIFRQLFDQATWTYTYLLADPETRDAVIIDPVREQVERDAQLIEELGLNLRYSLETHVHADHVTGSGALRERFGAQTVVSVRGGADCADIKADQGTRLEFGAFAVETYATPGHTPGCLTYVVRDGDEVLAFTGDALLVRGCGRTDFQQGSAHALYHSVTDKIFTLPDHTRIYPGHDYRGRTASTVAEEKQFNPRLRVGTTEDRFVAIMTDLKLADPRLMDVAVPANLACGKAA